MPNNLVVKTCSEIWKEVSDGHTAENFIYSCQLFYWYVVSSLAFKLPESEKAPFLEEERKLRAQYHIDAEHWKRNAQGGQEGKCGQIETENNDGLVEHARLTDHLCLPDCIGLVEPSGEQCT
jgi:hypothetical protein